VQGRNFVKGINEGIEALKSASDGALHSIYENMIGYAQLLQSHISKENNILFRMADQVFSSEEQQRLLIQFAGVDAKAEVEFNSVNSIQKINHLAAIYLQ
jgi:hemerythrin-like domain-containing protein